MGLIHVLYYSSPATRACIHQSFLRTFLVFYSRLVYILKVAQLKTLKVDTTFDWLYTIRLSQSEAVLLWKKVLGRKAMFLRMVRKYWPWFCSLEIDIDRYFVQRCSINTTSTRVRERERERDVNKTIYLVKSCLSLIKKIFFVVMLFFPLNPSASSTECHFVLFLFYLTLFQTSPGFYASPIQVFWKHCRTRRNCSLRAIFSFPTVFSTRLANSVSFSLNFKLLSANSSSLERCKICRFGKGYTDFVKVFLPLNSYMVHEFLIEIIIDIDLYDQKHCLTNKVRNKERNE